MRIGHQIYITLDEWTDNGSYDVQEILFYQNARGQWICIKNELCDYKKGLIARQKYARLVAELELN
ncbi:MAG: hypothetical protein J5953_08970 [Prevotella sp.]|nr:hypothetical protein [Prevotella sp.]